MTRHMIQQSLFDPFIYNILLNRWLWRENPSLNDGYLLSPHQRLNKVESFLINQIVENLVYRLLFQKYIRERDFRVEVVFSVASENNRREMSLRVSNWGWSKQLYMILIRRVIDIDYVNELKIVVFIVIEVKSLRYMGHVLIRNWNYELLVWQECASHSLLKWQIVCSGSSIYATRHKAWLNKWLMEFIWWR